MRYETAIWKLSDNLRLHAARRFWGRSTYIYYDADQIMIVDGGDPAKAFTPTVRESRAGDWRVF